MRRLFIIRKDLNLTPGKMGAMVGHCCEAYWTNMLKRHYQHAVDKRFPTKVDTRAVQFYTMIDNDVWNDYVNGIFTKTICEAKNLNQLKKVETIIKNMELKEGEDWGYINDCCLTELIPENDDGTTTIGVWFKPLSDEIAHIISAKYKLYGAFDKKIPEITYYEVISGTWRPPYDSCTHSFGKYSTLEEAKKHFEYLVAKEPKSNKEMSQHITLLTDTTCEYNDGNGRHYSLSIVKKTINDIREKFVEPM